MEQNRGVQHLVTSGKQLFVTRVSFVFRCDVICVGVSDEAEGWQGAVDVHLVGDDVNGRLT